MSVHPHAAPTRDLEVLWRPFSIGDVRLRNRVFVSAHTTNFGRDNLATARHVAYHRERARGGVGLIITEAIRVHATAAARDSTLGLFDDASIEPLAAVAQAVQSEGCRLFAQLQHSGRQAKGDLARTAAWGASPLPWATGAHVPHAMDAHEIGLIVDAFDQGAGRVVAAGVDGIEVHLGHGHLLEQFMSPASNRRTDAYGGTAAARLRFPREILERVLARVDGAVPVGIRISADEFLPGGLSPDDMIDIVGSLLGEFPLAFVHVSHSAYVGSWSLSTQMADMTFPTAPFRQFPARFKAAFPETPILAICRMDHLSAAADVVDSGHADLVGLTRAHIADPHLVAKTRAGRPNDVQACIACNQGCIGRIEQNLPMSCVVNPQVGFEGAWRDWRDRHRRPRSQRVLVVGGGPAGLRAALTACERGHDVQLVDAGEQLGGQLRLAARMRGRERLGLLTVDLERRVRAAGAAVELGRRVSAAEVVDGDWDGVVVATGSLPQPVTSPRWSATTVWDALADPDALGDHVAVIDEDGTWAGAGLALHLAAGGRRVELVAPVAGLAWNVTAYSRLSLVPLLGEAGVRVRPLRRVDEHVPGRLTLADAVTGELEHVPGVRSLVHVGPRAAQDQLRADVAGAGYAGRVVLVGDAYAPRSALEAVFEGELGGILAGGEDLPLLTDPGLPPYRS